MERKLSLLGLLILLIALPIGVIASFSEQIFTPHAATLPCATTVQFGTGKFLQTNGTALFYNGQRVCLYGATIYTSSGPGAPSGSWTSSSFTKRIDWDLQMAQTAHLNFIRVTDYINSSNSDPYNATVWQNMDYLVNQAQSKGIFVLMDLSSYANHLKSQNINPYDSKQDAGWQKFIAFVANRYKNSPNIAYYSIKGEVNPVGSSFPTATTQGYLDFYTRTTNGVYVNDSNHLIEAGGLTHLNQSNSGIPWQQIFGLPHVGLAAIHVYSANRLDPINGSNDLNKTLPAVAAWAKQNNKPLDIQEYGLVNQLGDSQRASAMQTIIQRAIDNGVAAIVYWNLGPETTSGMHYDVNPHFPLAWQQFINGASLFYNSSSYILSLTILSPTIIPTLNPTNTPMPTPTVSSYIAEANPTVMPVVTDIPTATPFPTAMPTPIPTDTPIPTETPTPTISQESNSVSATPLPTFAPTSTGVPTEVAQVNAQPTPTNLVAGSNKTGAAFGALFFFIILVVVILLVIPATRRKILLLLVKISFYEKNPIGKHETKDTSAIQTIDKTYDVKLLKKKKDQSPTWILLTDDSGSIEGYFDGELQKEGFMQVKGILHTDAAKPYITISSIEPQNNK